MHVCFCFFFSSRRRHTRYIGDWSSDVCSSDLRNPLRSPPPKYRGRGKKARQQRSTTARSPQPLKRPGRKTPARRDRKSTRLNSSHRCISYAVFCLKKKKKKKTELQRRTSQYAH